MLKNDAKPFRLILLLIQFSGKAVQMHSGSEIMIHMFVSLPYVGLVGGTEQSDES